MATATANAVESNTRTEEVQRQVTLRGTMPIMFDRYPGDNSTKLEWHQKIYMIPGTSDLCIPVLNLVSFLSAHNTNSAPKRLRDKRKYKDIANSCLSFVQIHGEFDSPAFIRFTRSGEPIRVGSFTEQNDPDSGLELHTAVARLDKGIPNPKERPLLPTPWELSFKLSIRPNTELKEQELKNLFREGGAAIGLGTFRGVFGKFEIDEWF